MKINGLSYKTGGNGILSVCNPDGANSFIMGNTLFLGDKDVPAVKF